MISRTINLKHIHNHWDEILRLAASIKQGTVAASLIWNTIYMQASLNHLRKQSIENRLSPLIKQNVETVVRFKGKSLSSV